MALGRFLEFGWLDWYKFDQVNKFEQVHKFEQVKKFERVRPDVEQVRQDVTVVRSVHCMLSQVLKSSCLFLSKRSKG